MPKEDLLGADHDVLTESYQPDIHYCPYCSHSLVDNNSLVVEYWNSEQNVFFIWCNNCEWRGEIVKIITVTTTEVEE